MSLASQRHYLPLETRIISNGKRQLAPPRYSADFVVMNKVLPRELHLARRMARLGTETAFEVLVKARALEAKGRDIVHLEIGVDGDDGAVIDRLSRSAT